MNKVFFIVLYLLPLFPLLSQVTITDTEDYYVCDEDGDGFVSIPFSELQNYALDVLAEFNESPEVYLTQAYAGIIRVRNLYNTNPQIQTVCGNTDGPGGFYDIAINSQQEIFIVRQGGILQKVNTQNQNCEYETIGQIHANGQSVLALSFDHLNNLYEGGWESQVYRAEANDLTNFTLWHDFGEGRAAGDFVQIGNYLYVAWTVNGADFLYKVTLGINNQYVSHENLGMLDAGTFGLAAEYGRLYGNTINYLYEINLETMQTNIVKQRPNQGNSSFNWWGAAGSHEALNLQITYHREENQAINGTTPLNDPFTNETTPEDWVYVRVHEEIQNTTYVIPVRIVVTTAPATQDTFLQNCKDETGLANFQLEDSQPLINPNSEINFTYFENLQNLESGQNPLPLSYSIPESKTVYVKVDSGAEDCYGVAELELIVPTANVQYDDQVAFCLGTNIVLSIPDEFNSYQWDGLQGEDLNQPLNLNEVTISLPGNYSVTVTDDLGCSHILPFEAVLGGSPEITDVIINGNSITVEVSPAGQYEYSLNGIFWQNSNTFQNIEIADYEIYVRDFAGCRSDKYEFSYFFVPNFISPNGDGYNDVWKIRGIEKYPDANVKIFDRNGKLFFDRKISNNEFVWNGKYLGRDIPSGTYWYIITISDDKKVTGSILVKN